MKEKLFISWSGDRSEAVAAALKSWLPLIFPDLHPWMSREDIKPGSAWVPALSEGFKDCVGGILCLTPDNLSAPWVHFEAGCLAKSFDNTHVIPFLLDCEIIGSKLPFEQFQATRCTKLGSHELVRTINDWSDKTRPAADLDTIFESLWNNLEVQLPFEWKASNKSSDSSEPAPQELVAPSNPNYESEPTFDQMVRVLFERFNQPASPTGIGSSVPPIPSKSASKQKPTKMNDAELAVYRGELLANFEMARSPAEEAYYRRLIELIDDEKKRRVRELRS